MKKTFASLGLLAALGSGELHASEALFNVSQEIHQEAGAIFAQKKESAKARFEKLVDLSHQIQELNDWVSKKKGITKAELDVLYIVNGVLDFTFHQFKNKYEKIIYALYTQEFRLFSAVRNTFKSNLKQLNDSLNGIRIVEVQGLSLSPDEVATISQNAKALEEKILNAS
ncbi:MULTISPECIES: hypothetical protein [unclassified Mannheimia]|uniref:hypothetical protein n=1 Tax=unclassified Mannheimia TaxID=2645054 RepID=UPI00359E9636